MNADELHPASYRGAFFFIKGATTSGGRKVVRKLPVNSDKQLLEDMGLVNRTFTVDGTIAARRSNDGTILTPYQQVRDKLLDALELGGIGILVHPFFGRLDNIVVVTWSLSENIGSLGDAPITITFEVSNTDGIPIKATNVLSKVQTDADSVVSAALLSIGLFNVAYVNNFQHAVDKLEDFSAKIRSITTPVAANVDNLNEYRNDLSKFESSTITLVNNPADLATDILNLIGNIDTLYPSASTVLSAYIKLFDYGDDDTEFSILTAVSQERAVNRDLLNGGIQSAALAYAYLNASKIEYETVNSIEETNQSLELQYQKLYESDGVDPDVMESLTKLRTTAQGFFDDEKLTTRRVITVMSPPTSTRLLAYQYYGESGLGESIAELNGFSDLVFVQGNMEIFTA